MSSRYVAFLRGINVGGHHKVPMAELKDELTKNGCSDIVTILNSGNVIFTYQNGEVKGIEAHLKTALKARFGFGIPTIVVPLQVILDLHTSDPFKEVELTSDIRRYITLSSEPMHHEISFPWTSDDASFQILALTPNIVVSVLGLSKSKTPAAMKILEDTYGKEITTRNWNTIERIVKKVT